MLSEEIKKKYKEVSDKTSEIKVDYIEDWLLIQQQFCQTPDYPSDEELDALCPPDIVAAVRVIHKRVTRLGIRNKTVSKMNAFFHQKDEDKTDEEALSVIALMENYIDVEKNIKAGYLTMTALIQSLIDENKVRYAEQEKHPDFKQRALELQNEINAADEYEKVKAQSSCEHVFILFHDGSVDSTKGGCLFMDRSLFTKMPKIIHMSDDIFKLNHPHLKFTYVVFLEKKTAYAYRSKMMSLYKDAEVNTNKRVKFDDDDDDDDDDDE